MPLPDQDLVLTNLRDTELDASLVADLYRNVEMPGSPARRSDTGAERILRGGSHPVIAIIAFFAAFLFAAFPFALGSDDFLIVSPSIIASFTCSILFIRLLVGDLNLVNYIFLFIAGVLCFLAGNQWYIVAVLAGGTLLCSFLIARLIGDFVPVIRGVKY